MAGENAHRRSFGNKALVSAVYTVGDTHVEVNPAGLQKGTKKMKTHARTVGLLMLVVAVVAPNVIAGDRSAAGIGNRSCAVRRR